MSDRTDTFPARGILRSGGRDGEQLAEIEFADRLLARVVGLIGRESFPDDRVMFFPGCRGIHTLGMRFPIDVIFVKGAVPGEVKVEKIRRDVKPWRSPRSHRSAEHVIEARAGSARRWGLRDGDSLRIEIDE